MKLIRLLAVLSFFPLIAQTPQEILDDHFEKYGQDLWEGIGTAVIDGKWTTKEFQKFPVKITVKNPNKIRLEGIWDRKRFAEVFNGVNGWSVAPWTGTQRPSQMNFEDQLLVKNLFSLGSPLGDYRYRNQLAFVGLELHEGELYLHFRHEEEKTVYDYFLGKEDHMLYWEEIHSKESPDIYVKKQYEKYRSFSGLLAPTSVRIKSTNHDRELIFENMVLGIGANDSLFEVPEQIK